LVLFTHTTDFSWLSQSLIYEIGGLGNCKNLN
jgi:hypothetical protein